MENKRLQKISTEELERKQAEVDELCATIEGERLKFKDKLHSFEENHLDKAVRRAQHLEQRLHAMKEID